jgi:hypothetical protein
MPPRAYHYNICLSKTDYAFILKVKQGSRIPGSEGSSVIRQRIKDKRSNLPAGLRLIEQAVGVGYLSSSFC